MYTCDEDEPGKYVDLEGQGLKELYVPDNCTCLIVSRNELEELEVPHTIEVIICPDNKLKRIKVRGGDGKLTKLEHLDVKNNQLEEIPELPQTIEFLFIAGNPKDMKIPSWRFLFNDRNDYKEEPEGDYHPWMPMPYNDLFIRYWVEDKDV
jgi:Leucine-rich repeat (LRR) protein